MSARDEFIDVLRSRNMLKPGEEWVIDANLARYAHELAEKIRAAVEADRAYRPKHHRGMREGANLIDPEVKP